MLGQGLQSEEERPQKRPGGKSSVFTIAVRRAFHFFVENRSRKRRKKKEGGLEKERQTPVKKTKESPPGERLVQHLSGERVSTGCKNGTVGGKKKGVRTMVTEGQEAASTYRGKGKNRKGWGWSHVCDRRKGR